MSKASQERDEALGVARSAVVLADKERERALGFEKALHDSQASAAAVTSQAAAADHIPSPSELVAMSEADVLAFKRRNPAGYRQALEALSRASERGTVQR